MKRFILCAFFGLGLLWPASTYAKIHYINKGVKYHIGDNRFALSEDSTFVGAHAVVGQEWVQAFKVSEADQVKVHIDKIWGVDDCPYCKVIISIDDKDMLRLFQSNNNKPVETLEPLAQTLQPGVTHYLKIASYGDTSVDDFMVQDISVETQKADATFPDPPKIGDPLPTPTPVVVISPCESAIPKMGWIPDEAAGKMSFELKSANHVLADSGVLGSLAPGEAIEFQMYVDTMQGAKDIVNHAVEFVFQGQGTEKEAWVLSFNNPKSSQLHGNMIREGIYRSEAFQAGAYQPSAWNRVRIHSCADGQIHMMVNGKAASLKVASGLKAQDFMIRAVGLRVAIARSGPAPAAAPALLPVPGSF